VVGRVAAALRALRIEHLAERDPQRLSGGQAQLVALASVVALGPRYLVLDEPTSQLDPQGTRLVGEALAAIAAEGRSGVLLVEHKTDLLDRLCTRVVVLSDGRTVRDGAAPVVLADPELEALGVEPPARVRLAARLAAAGLSIDPAVLSQVDA
jgi:energy-coupling factor transporter ATP-binding protein EcfA2